MSTLLVFCTYLMGNLLFNRIVGILAAMFLSLSAYFVELAHFATVDPAANFWYWVSCLFSLFMWKRGGRSWYILTAVTAGFAIGTKIDRVCIFIPLILSHFLRNEGFQLRKLLRILVLVIFGYIFANPTLLVSFFEFILLK